MTLTDGIIEGGRRTRRVLWNNIPDVDASCGIVIGFELRRRFALSQQETADAAKD